VGQKRKALSAENLDDVLLPVAGLRGTSTGSDSCGTSGGGSGSDSCGTSTSSGSDSCGTSTSSGSGSDSCGTSGDSDSGVTSGDSDSGDSGHTATRCRNLCQLRQTLALSSLEVALLRLGDRSSNVACRSRT
jgi:hypothetical protein